MIECFVVGRMHWWSPSSWETLFSKPFWDLPSAVAEMERLHSLGMWKVVQVYRSTPEGWEVVDGRSQPIHPTAVEERDRIDDVVRKLALCRGMLSEILCGAKDGCVLVVPNDPVGIPWRDGRDLAEEIDDVLKKTRHDG